MVSRNLEQVVEWILARHPEIQDIDPCDDLIESRLIDSLSFMELIILIERLTGTPIEVAEININDFRSLNNIEQSFFAESHAKPRR